MNSHSGCHEPQHKDEDDLFHIGLFVCKIKFFYLPSDICNNPEFSKSCLGGKRNGEMVFGEAVMNTIEINNS